MAGTNYWSNPKEYFQKASPGALLFGFVVILILLGAIIPGLGFLLKAGLFLLVFFIVLWIVWIIFQANGM